MNNNFESLIKSALAQYIKAVNMAHGRFDEQAADLKKSKNSDVSQKRAIASACGQAVGAAGFRARRGLLVAMLHARRAEGLDITATGAKRILEKLLGGKKSVAWPVLVAEFGEPGRTSAHKSEIDDNQQQVIADGLRESLEQFDRELAQLKRSLNRTKIKQK